MCDHQIWDHVREDEIRQRILTIQTATSSANRRPRSASSNVLQQEQPLIWPAAANIGARPSSAQLPNATQLSPSPKGWRVLPERNCSYGKLPAPNGPSSGKLRRVQLGGSGGRFTRPASSSSNTASRPNRRPHAAQVPEGLIPQCTKVGSGTRLGNGPINGGWSYHSSESSNVERKQDARVYATSLCDTDPTRRLSVTDLDRAFEQRIQACKVVRRYSANSLERGTASKCSIPELPSCREEPQTKVNGPSTLSAAATKLMSLSSDMSGVEDPDVVHNVLLTKLIFVDLQDSPKLLQERAAALRPLVEEAIRSKESLQLSFLQKMLTVVERKQELLSGLIKRTSAFVDAAAKREEYLRAAAAGSSDLSDQTLNDAANFCKYLQRCVQDKKPGSKADPSRYLEELCYFFRLPPRHEVVVHSRRTFQELADKWAVSTRCLTELEVASSPRKREPLRAIERMIEFVVRLGIPHEHPDLSRAWKLAVEELGASPFRN